MSTKHQDAADTTNVKEPEGKGIYQPILHSGRKTSILMLNYFLISFIALVPPYLLGFSLTTNAVFLALGLIVSGSISEWYDQKLEKKLREKLASKNAFVETNSQQA